VKRWVVLVTFRISAAQDEVQEWFESANAVAGSSVSANLPGSVGGAGAVWDLRTTEDSLADVSQLLDAACLTSTEALALDPIASGYRHLDGARVKRTLALAVREGTPASQIHRFERSLSAMPDHIPEIRSWSLSRVGAGSTTQYWTHVWEQEYADVDGLRIAYLRSPYHWTGVDRWFDPEVPCSIVDPHLSHMFRWANQAVLGRTTQPSL
jgi:Stress responsive A/B Barrel Domain